MEKYTARKLAIGATALLALLAGVIAFQQLGQSSKVPRYLTAKAIRADVVSSVMTTGSLQASRQVDVGARVSGQLQSLKVQLGDRVAKGQLLAEIDPVLSQNALLSARASLSALMAQRLAAAANLLQARLAYLRQEEMIATDATSRQELELSKAQLEQLRANLASLDAQINQARIQVDSAQANLEYTKITAPIDGEVVAIVTQEGQTVVAAQQAPVILKLANLDVMTVRAQISEADVVRLQPGQDAHFTILGDMSHRHVGKVATIEPAPQEYMKDEAKSTGPVFYNALFNVPNPDHRLRIAMTAQVTIVLSAARNVISVPISALGKGQPDGHYPVRVMDKDGNISTVIVAPGINDRVRIQVEGLNEGDEVITEEGGGKASPGAAS